MIFKINYKVETKKFEKFNFQKNHRKHSFTFYSFTIFF